MRATLARNLSSLLEVPGATLAAEQFHQEHPSGWLCTTCGQQPAIAVASTVRRRSYRLPGYGPGPPTGMTDGPVSARLIMGCIVTLDALPGSSICGAPPIPGIGGMQSAAGAPQTMQRPSFSQHAEQRVNSAKFVCILVRHEQHSWILESTFGRLSLVLCLTQYFGGPTASVWDLDTIGWAPLPGAVAQLVGLAPGLGLEFSTIDRTGVAASRGSGPAPWPQIMQRFS